MFSRLLLAAGLVAGLAFGQGRGMGDVGGGDMGMGGSGMSGGRGMGEGMGGGMSRGPQRQSKLDQFYDKLKLNKDQKEEAAKILADSANQVRPLVDQYNKTRQQVAMALLGKKSDDEIKPLMAAYVAVCAQMTTAEAWAFGKIYAQLKPNQQKNAPQAFELLSGVFLPSPGVGRGMGRGMGRGGRN